MLTCLNHINSSNKVYITNSYSLLEIYRNSIYQGTQNILSLSHPLKQEKITQLQPLETIKANY